MAGHRARLELDASLGVDAGFASGRIHVLAAREERVANLGAPALEGDVLSATVQFPYGSNVDEAEKAGRALQASAEETMEKFGGDEFLRGMFLRVGSAPPQRGPGPDSLSSGSHVVSLEINLVPGEERDFTSAQFKDAWQAANQEFVGARSVVFTSAIGPSAGAAVALQLSHRSSDVLSAASAETTASLSAYSDLTNIENGFVGGKRQLNFTLKEEAARERLLL